MHAAAADLVLSRPVMLEILEVTNISCPNRRQLALERIKFALISLLGHTQCCAGAIFGLHTVI
jgi:hypothetical protein